ncbi:hypothetical protein [Streptomyces chartreusis]|uniref:hypothetical protein n=1 Tax=Streptomyces chartreusis TaxID=1969 RepID=UPI003647ABFC
MTSVSHGAGNTGAANHLLEEARQGLEKLQTMQVAYDDAMWDIENTAHAKLRHIHIHLSVTLGKLAKIIEPDDHRDHRAEEVDVRAHADELSPIVADLLMHCAQISNLVGGNMGEFLTARYIQNAKRFAPSSAFAELDGHNSQDEFPPDRAGL